MPSHNGRNKGRNRADRESESLQALVLYSNGFSGSQIAARLGVSLTTAHARIHAGQAMQAKATVDELRDAIHTMLLESCRQFYIEREAADNATDRIRAGQALVKAAMEISRLEGLNRPPEMVIEAIRQGARVADVEGTYTVIEE